MHLSASKDVGGGGGVWGCGGGGGQGAKGKPKNILFVSAHKVSLPSYILGEKKRDVNQIGKRPACSVPSVPFWF